jgi:hypothetical protein
MGDASDPVAAEARAPSLPAGRSGSPAELGRAGGAHLLTRAIGNEAMGRLLRSPSGRDALGRAARAGPRRGRMLARQLVAMDAPAEREIGPHQRPPGKAFFESYSKVSYDVWKRGKNPPGEDEGKQQNGPWAFIGGSVGKMFGASDPGNPSAGPRLPQHTCAARLSWALNHGFAATAIKSGVMFYNDPKVTYAGTPGDGKNYIVGAPAMQTYLTKEWGPPDVKLSKLDVYGIDVSTGSDVKTAEGDASALRTRLGPEGVAVFAGAHHVGVISQKLKTDDYIYYDPDVVPAVAWILP